MPAKSVAQQKLMAIAKNSPSKVLGKNKGVLAMSKQSLDDFASTPLGKLPSKVKTASNSIPSVSDGSNVLAKIAGGKGSSIVNKIAKKRVK